MASPNPSPTSAVPPKLRRSREIVLSTSLELVDAEGLDALTMRRLGQEPGRDLMSLYRYAANRTALQDGVAETVLNELAIFADDRTGRHSCANRPRPAAPGPAASQRRPAAGHPATVHTVGLRPLGTIRPLEQILALLVDAGFTPADALHVHRTYYGFLYGHILNELQEYVVDPDENEAILRLGLHRLPAKDFPHLRALGPVLAEYDGDLELDQGLSILLTGLAAQLSGSSPRSLT